MQYILILAVLAVIGYFVYKNKDKLKAEAQNVEQEVESKVASVTKTVETPTQSVTVIKTVDVSAGSGGQFSPFPTPTPDPTPPTVTTPPVFGGNVPVQPPPSSGFSPLPPQNVPPPSTSTREVPFPGYGTTGAGSLVSFSVGETVYFAIPADTAGNCAPSGEGVYPEGLDMDMIVSKVPGDFTTAANMVVTTTGFGGVPMQSKPYIQKVSNGSGIVWSRSANGAAQIPAGETWYCSFRSNNIAGQFYCQCSKQG